MCRFLVFKGKDPILLSSLLTRPAHSIIKQSYDSRLRMHNISINADGFGISYYPETSSDIEGPCTFRATTPLWNNLSLEVIAEKTKSNLVFAHVRASTYGVLSETNCHPFTYNNFTFMHNGGIASFSHIKKRLMNHIKDEYYDLVQGSTDSESCFVLFLDCLDKLGANTSAKPGETSHNKIRQALLQTIEYVNLWQSELPSKPVEPSLMNFAVTDGDTIVVTRYISSKTDEAASLHFSTGSNFIEYEPGQFKMERKDRLQDVIMISSEPLTFERGDWIAVPTNSTLTVKSQTVLLHPIIDEFYQEDLQFERNSQFAESKGLMGSVPYGEEQESELPPLEREGRVRVPTTITA